MGAIKRDWEERVSDKAEQMAIDRYQTAFRQLSPNLQMQTWIEAEHLVTDEMVGQKEAARDALREQGSDPYVAKQAFQSPDADHWQELELSRRLGK